MFMAISMYNNKTKTIRQNLRGVNALARWQHKHKVVHKYLQRGELCYKLVVLT